MATLEEAAGGVAQRFMHGLWAGLKFVGTILLCIAIALVIWAVIRHLLWRLRSAHANHKDTLAGRDTLGNPLPPPSRGICQTCQKYAEQIYTIDNNRRLCRPCYDKEASQPPSTDNHI